MSAAKLNIVIEQGATWSKTLTLTDTDTGLPIDLTGYTFRGQMRTDYDAAAAAASFTCTVASALEGIVTVYLSATATAAIAYGGYVYDIEMVKPDTTVARLLYGKAKVTPEVTK